MMIAREVFGPTGRTPVTGFSITWDCATVHGEPIAALVGMPPGQKPVVLSYLNASICFTREGKKDAEMEARLLTAELEKTAERGRHCLLLVTDSPHSQLKLGKIISHTFPQISHQLDLCHLTVVVGACASGK
jgi:hypothetical protein